MTLKGCLDNIQAKAAWSPEDLRVLANEKGFVENGKVVEEYAVKELPSFSARPRNLWRSRIDPYLSFILLLLFLAFILYSLSNYLQRVFYDPYVLGAMVLATAGFFVMLAEVRRSLRKAVQAREYRSIGHRSADRPAKRARRSEKNQTALLRSKCSSCGSKLLMTDSIFCANCGASLQLTSMGDASTSEYRSTLLGDECMVCGLEMNLSDKLIWCPYCGNAAHREHLLAWLRLRSTCPICNRRIASTQLVKLGGKAWTR